MKYSKRNYSHSSYSFLFFFKKTTVLLCISSIVFIQIVESQSNDSNDSLTSKNYQYLHNKISEFYNTPIQGNIYANAYLNKAKKNKDSVKIVDGFYYLSEINHKDYYASLDYIDEAINYNDKRKLNILTPYIYNQKGSLFQKRGEYKNALDNFIEAKSQLAKYNNPDLLISVEHNIGLLRLRIKDFENALNVFNRSYHYILKNNVQDKFKYDYLNLFSKVLR